MAEHNETGRRGEDLATAFLLSKGYGILERNWKSCRKEIDIIAQDGRDLVFVEVKKRTNLEKAAYAILPAQQQRIWKAAENFIQDHPEFSEFDIRFDAFLFCSPFCFQHISDAWRSW